MFEAFFSGAHQAITPRIFLSVIGTILLIFLGSTEDIVRFFQEKSFVPMGYHTAFMTTALTSDTVVSFIPVLAALPFSGAYLDDLKSKFARFLLMRSSFGNYVLSRILVCFLFGGGLLFVGGILSWGISTLLYMPMEILTNESVGSADQLWQFLGLIFIVGGFWAVVGLAMSTIMESKYIAYVSPFVIYYLLVILCERYLPELYILYPPNWTNPEMWPYGAWGAMVFLLELTSAFSILFIVRAESRLHGL